MNQFLRLLAVLLVSMLLAFSAPAQTNASNSDQDGVSLYKNGEYQAAIPKLIRETDNGSIDAQFHLGMAHFHGNGVPKSEIEGVALYRMAAEAGHIRAANALGWAYGNARGGLAKNMEMAVKWYRIAAEGGDQYGQFNMGLVYDNGWTVPISHTEAFNWFQKAADQGNAAAATYVGLAYEQGQGVPKDESAAVAWYLKGAQRGDKWGMTNYAYTRYIGRGSPKSYEEAFKWFSAAAQENYARAQYNLGLMYENGHGVPVDYVEARSWYKKAADQNYDGASDKFESLREKALAQSAQNPQTSLPAGPDATVHCEDGNLDDCWDRYKTALDNPRDYPVDWAKLGCAAGSGELCSQAAYLLRSGKRNTPVNLQLSNAYYMRGCDEYGHKDSCFNAAVQYRNGNGVARDYGLAYSYFHRACLKGDRESCLSRDKVQRQMNSGGSYDDMTIRRANDPNGYLSQTGPVCRPKKIIQNGRMHTITECLDRDVAKKRGWVK